MSDSNGSNPNDPPASPKREPFFETVRRFSDLQFTTILHSLTGLPSSLTPPQPSGWITDDDLPAGQVTSLPSPQRSGSDSLGVVAELHKKELRDVKDDSDSGSGNGGGGGVGVGAPAPLTAPRPAPATAPESEPANKRDREAPVLFSFAPLAGVLDTLRDFSELHRELFRVAPAPPAPTKDVMAGEQEAQTTELDYYNFFSRSFRGESGTGVVESYSDVRSVAGTDGVVKTRRVEVQRFADGREVRWERDGVVLPSGVAATGNDTVTEIGK